MSAHNYRRSSFSVRGPCVEVAELPDGNVALRDSKSPDQPPHVFTAAEWDAFVAGIVAGEFTRSAPEATPKAEPPPYSRMLSEAIGLVEASRVVDGSITRRHETGVNWADGAVTEVDRITVELVIGPEPSP